MTPHIIAAQARERIAQRPCTCKSCVIAENLPAVLRIIEAKRQHIALKAMEASA